MRFDVAFPRSFLDALKLCDFVSVFCIFLGCRSLAFQKRLLFLAIVNKKSFASHFSLLAIAAILQNWAPDKAYMLKCVL